MMMTNEERIKQAVDNFMSGFNCSQSVVSAFAEEYGFTREQALHMAASFGAGIGRMRLTCGAVCGMLMLAGLEHCALEGSDRKSKSENYALVRRLAAEFQRRNGSITCRELLGLRKAERSAEASERTPEYYATRPCARMIESAARIWVDYKEGRLPEEGSFTPPVQQTEI